MAKTLARFINFDSQSLNDNSDVLELNLNTTGGLTKDTNGVSIDNNGVKVNNIDWGIVSPDQVAARSIPITDTGNYFGIDTVEEATQSLASKIILYRHTVSGFQNVQAVATNGDSTTDALHNVIANISGNNDGGGNSTTVGVVVNTTINYQIPIRMHDTQNPVDDGNGNEVYARLEWVGTGETATYQTQYYSMVSGTETAYTGFTTSDMIDFGYIYFSQHFMNLPWADVFLSGSWQDLAGVAASLPDDNISVNGMTDLLSGLTTQAQVNAKLDDLGSTVNGEGASLLAIEDSATFYTGANIEAALTELGTALGGTDSTTRDFTENNVVSDNDSFFTAIDKLDEKWGDLGSVSNGEGASLVGLEDSGGYYPATDVEAAFAQIASALGGTTINDRDFTEENVIADNDSVFSALNKLDMKWGDLASTSNGEGASLVGIEDTGGYFTATDVEAALQELGSSVGNIRKVETVTLTATDITNAYITLSSTPNTPAYTVLTIKGGCDQFYGDDFTVSGAQLSWSGLGLDGVLVAGDKLTVVYN